MCRGLLCGMGLSISTLCGNLLAAPAQPPAYTPPASAHLQIVNATGVPKIALSLNGKPYYPEFEQGLWIPGAPLEGATLKCTVVNLTDGQKAESAPLSFKPQTFQTLIIMGDFSTDVAQGDLPQSSSSSESQAKVYLPNILFKVYSHEMGADEKFLRLRFVNAMPRTTLKVQGEQFDQTSIPPGADILLNGQSPTARYTAVAGDKSYSIGLSQREEKNMIIVFYLKDGAPAYRAVNE